MAPTNQTPRRSLSRRLLWLTITMVLIGQLLAFLPMLARERRVWLNQRIAEAQIALFTAPPRIDGISTPEDMLRLAGADGVRLERADGRTLSLPATLPGAAALIDLQHETFTDGLSRAVSDVFDGRDRLVEFRNRSALQPGARVSVILRTINLHRMLITMAARAGTVSLLVAAVAGLIVYMTLLFLLVRPMRHIIGSIAAFRADPERTPPLEPGEVMPLSDDEMAVAGHQLAAMQRELRLALWRNARLAALGTAVAKVSHDLRGTLSPALLAAERLQASGEPSINRAGDILVRSIDRATDIVRKTLEFSREGPVLPQRTRLDAGAVIDEAIEQARTGFPTLRVERTVPDATQIDADRGQMIRLLANLIRNAAEAGAKTVFLMADVALAELRITVADDGPGLPETVQDRLFQPFVTGGRRGSTGLGLAIVRDLARAHGGEVSLVETSAAGTTFRVTLPCVPQRAGRAEAVAEGSG